MIPSRLGTLRNEKCVPILQDSTSLVSPPAAAEMAQPLGPPAEAAIFVSDLHRFLHFLIHIHRYKDAEVRRFHSGPQSGRFKAATAVFPCFTSVFPVFLPGLTAEVKLGSVQNPPVPSGPPLPSVSFSISGDPLTRVLFDHLLLSLEIRQPVLIWQRRSTGPPFKATIVGRAGKRVERRVISPWPTVVLGQPRHRSLPPRGNVLANGETRRARAQGVTGSNSGRPGGRKETRFKRRKEKKKVKK